MKKIYLHSVSLFLLFFHDSVMEPTNPTSALTYGSNSFNHFMCVSESMAKLARSFLNTAFKLDNFSIPY